MDTAMMVIDLVATANRLFLLGFTKHAETVIKGAEALADTLDDMDSKTRSYNLISNYYEDAHDRSNEARVLRKVAGVMGIQFEEAH